MYSLQNCRAITLTDGGAVVCPNKKRALQVDADSPMDEAQNVWSRKLLKMLGIFSHLSRCLSFYIPHWENAKVLVVIGRKQG